MCRQEPDRILTYAGQCAQIRMFQQLFAKTIISVYSHVQAFVDQMVKPYYLSSLGVVVGGNLITLFKTCERSLAQVRSRCKQNWLAGIECVRLPIM